MDSHAAGTADEAQTLKQEEDMQMEKVRTQIDAPQRCAREREATTVDDLCAHVCVLLRLAVSGSDCVRSCGSDLSFGKLHFWYKGTAAREGHACKEQIRQNGTRQTTQRGTDTQRRQVALPLLLC